MEQIGQIQTKQ